jgi:hypothetical protein
MRCQKPAKKEVEALGIETRDTSAPSAADRRENVEKDTTQDDAKQREGSASPDTTDEAIRKAAKVAIDAYDYTRARALLDLRDAKPRKATVTSLAAVRDHKR